MVYVIHSVMYIYILLLPQITNLRARGMEFLELDDIYYKELEEKLEGAKITVKEDLATVSVTEEGKPLCKVVVLACLQNAFDDPF